jgi:hypothetical protein
MVLLFSALNYLSIVARGILAVYFLGLASPVRLMGFLSSTKTSSNYYSVKKIC